MWRAEFPSTTQWNGTDEGWILVRDCVFCCLSKELQELTKRHLYTLVSMLFEQGSDDERRPYFLYHSSFSFYLFYEVFTLFPFSHLGGDVCLVPFADPLGWFFHSVLWNLRIYGQLGIALVLCRVVLSRWRFCFA